METGLKSRYKKNKCRRIFAIILVLELILESVSVLISIERKVFAEINVFTVGRVLKKCLLKQQK